MNTFFSETRFASAPALLDQGEDQQLIFVEDVEYEFIGGGAEATNGF